MSLTQSPMSWTVSSLIFILIISSSICYSDGGRPWAKHEPSPGASPSSSILKKTILNEETSEYNIMNLGCYKTMTYRTGRIKHPSRYYTMLFLISLIINIFYLFFPRYTNTLPSTLQVSTCEFC